MLVITKLIEPLNRIFYKLYGSRLYIIIQNDKYNYIIDLDI